MNGKPSKNEHNFGYVVIRIGRVEVEVKTTSGDEGRKAKEKFKPALKKWMADNGTNFHVARCRMRQP